MNPTIEAKKSAGVTRHEFTLTGGTLAGSWGQAAHGAEAWCKITVWDLGGPSEHVGSYGGSVWPPAWPQWFVELPSSVQLGSGRIGLTDAGRVALLAAVEVL